jgi:hypothetical protein
MFRAAMGPSSGGTSVFMRHLVLVILRGWLSCMHSTLHTRQSSTQNNKYLRSHKHGCSSWWWVHSCPKHVEIDKYTKNKLYAKLVLFTRILVSNYNIHYQIKNNASVYGILTRKKSICHIVFFGLLFSPVGVSQIRLQQQSANIFGHIFPCTSFQFGIYPDGNFRLVYRRRLPCFQEEIQMDMQKMKFQWHVTPHSTVWWNKILHNFTLIFRFFIT